MKSVTLQERGDDQVRELMMCVMRWREKWGVKHRKIEIKIKEEVAFVSITDDYTPQDFEIAR